MALLELEGISQVFKTRRGEVKAVDDVSFDLEVGGVLCLVGESGSGKTTTARIAAGLTKPTEGTVRFDGRQVDPGDKATFRDFRLAAQYIHQDPYSSLNPIRDIFGTLSAPLRRHRIAKSRDEAWDRSGELLGRVGLKPAETFLQKFPHQLSGGQRQRIAVARALALDPRLIIADEATSMLDVSIRLGLLKTLSALRKELGVAFVFITHDLAVAKNFGWEGSTAVMHRGRVVEYGPTARIIGQPEHPYTQALIEAVPEPDPDLALSKRRARNARKAELAGAEPDYADVAPIIHQESA